MRRITAGAAIIIMLISSAGIAGAQDIGVWASVNQRQVPVNGRLQLSLHIEGTQQAEAPDLSVDGFDVQYLGPSTQISIVNGQMTSSVTHTYLLSPRQTGTFTIGPIPVNVGGKSFKTDPIHIEVVSQGSALSPSPAGSGDDTTDIGQALQLQLGLDDTRVYVNQEVPLRLQLLVGQVGVRGIEMPKLQADGFLVRPIGQPRQSQVVVGGVTHTLVEFDTVVIPIRPGELTLGPASIECQVVQRRASRRSSPFGREPFEDFFDHSLLDELFSSAQLVPVTVQAPEVNLQVLSLPSEGKPADFSGAVGRFTFDATAVPQQVAAGEPVTLTMTIRGEGNLDSVTPPRVSPDGLAPFKVYEPQQRSGTSAANEKIFEQVLIPLEASVRQLPQLSFSYFDPQEQRYHTLTQGPIPLMVQAAPAQPVVPAAPAPGGSGPGPGTLVPEEEPGRDIIYIKEEPGALHPVGWGWYHAAVVWWYAAAAMVWIISEISWRRRRRLLADPAAARASGAMKRAMAAWQSAKLLHDRGRTREGYEALFRLLQRYLGDRMNLTAEGVTKDVIHQALRPRGAPGDVLGQIDAVIDLCDAAKFAPASQSADQLGRAVELTRAALISLERWAPS